MTVFEAMKSDVKSCVSLRLFTKRVSGNEDLYRKQSSELCLMYNVEARICYENTGYFKMAFLYLIVTLYYYFSF